jgi:hypothetical protein
MLILLQFYGIMSVLVCAVAKMCGTVCQCAAVRSPVFQAEAVLTPLSSRIAVINCNNIALTIILRQAFLGKAGLGINNTRR